jgi:NAD(P)-dependent dehydrogenase (short-subunit alcohol dehydrogenase family)
MGGGRLTDKVVVVTGAAGGIGSAAARAFAAEGGQVAAIDADGGMLDSLDSELGVGHMHLVADVSDEDQVARSLEQVAQKLGRVDVLFNAAGIQLLELDAPVDRLDLDVWQRTLAVNLTGLYLCCKHGLRQMIPRQSGSIINCGSPTALSGRGWRYHAYSASKGGVHALTRAMAGAYGSDGIRVNCIVPGVIETAMTAPVRDDPGRVGEIVGRTLLGRLGRPDDLVGISVFLASDESAFATGGTYVVDGGLLIT